GTVDVLAAEIGTPAVEADAGLGSLDLGSPGTGSGLVTEPVRGPAEEAVLDQAGEPAGVGTESGDDREPQEDGEDSGIHAIEVDLAAEDLGDAGAVAGLTGALHGGDGDARGLGAQGAAQALGQVLALLTQESPGRRWQIDGF